METEIVGDCELLTVQLPDVALPPPSDVTLPELQLCEFEPFVMIDVEFESVDTFDVESDTGGGLVVAGDPPLTGDVDRAVGGTVASVPAGATKAVVPCAGVPTVAGWAVASLELEADGA